MISPTGVLQFPSIFEKSAYKDGQPKHSITVVWVPQNLEGEDKTLWDAMIAEANRLCQEKFGCGLRGEFQGQPIKSPIKRGEFKPKWYAADQVYMKFSTNGKFGPPKVVDKSLRPITQADDKLYSGAMGRVSFEMKTFQNGENSGVTCYLNNVQVLAPGTRMIGSNPEDEFSASQDSAGAEF